jgi:protoporphyrinogen oxidase
VTVEVESLVVGAGVAGLGAALELERAGGEVLVVDAFAHPGGVMATDEIRGYRVERGPNTFQIKPALRGFLLDHALDSSLCAASPESRKRFILQRGQLVPVPMDPLRFARTRLLSAGGKL